MFWLGDCSIRNENLPQFLTISEKRKNEITVRAALLSTAASLAGWRSTRN
jgi:hypothetical protein